MKRAKVVVAALACSFLLCSVAQADPLPEGRAGTERGYRYVFDDDPLAAGAFGPNDTRIRVIPGAARQTLIRPRTSFVAELLVSVEKI